MVDASLGQNLYVSGMFRKSFIEANKKGTEAPAASFALAAKSAAFPAKIDFVADHPFMFLIRENTIGMVPFIDQVLDPCAG